MRSPELRRNIPWGRVADARLDDLEALRDADRFRFANRLSAWIEVEDGRVVDAGYEVAG